MVPYETDCLYWRLSPVGGCRTESWWSLNSSRGGRDGGYVIESRHGIESAQISNGMRQRGKMPGLFTFSSMVGVVGRQVTE